jgi:hypothetical protein
VKGKEHLYPAKYFLIWRNRASKTAAAMSKNLKICEREGLVDGILQGAQRAETSFDYPIIFVVSDFVAVSKASGTYKLLNL